jgi:hypothetical protein
MVGKCQSLLRTQPPASVSKIAGHSWSLRKLAAGNERRAHWGSGDWFDYPWWAWAPVMVVLGYRVLQGSIYRLINSAVQFPSASLIFFAAVASPPQLGLTAALEPESREIAPLPFTHVKKIPTELRGAKSDSPQPAARRKQRPGARRDQIDIGRRGDIFWTSFTSTPWVPRLISSRCAVRGRISNTSVAVQAGSFTPHSTTAFYVVLTDWHREAKRSRLVIENGRALFNYFKDPIWLVFQTSKWVWPVLSLSNRVRRAFEIGGIEISPNKRPNA